jgi:hypothetical protein
MKGMVLIYCFTATGFSMYGTLPDERTELSLSESLLFIIIIIIGGAVLSP